jgi:hypothetical protein
MTHHDVDCHSIYPSTHHYIHQSPSHAPYHASYHAIYHIFHVSIFLRNIRVLIPFPYTFKTKINVAADDIAITLLIQFYLSYSIYM